jgi:hypothetical protein
LACLKDFQAVVVVVMGGNLASAACGQVSENVSACVAFTVTACLLGWCWVGHWALL